MPSINTSEERTSNNITTENNEVLQDLLTIAMKTLDFALFSKQDVISDIKGKSDIINPELTLKVTEQILANKIREKFKLV